MEDKPKKRGPKPKYEHLRPNQDGAPTLTVRLNSEIYTRIRSRSEGARAYIENLVTEDALKERASDVPT
jgi:hypothetical protein